MGSILHVKTNPGDMRYPGKFPLPENQPRSGRLWRSRLPHGRDPPCICNFSSVVSPASLVVGAAVATATDEWRRRRNDYGKYGTWPHHSRLRSTWWNSTPHTAELRLIRGLLLAHSVVCWWSLFSSPLCFCFAAFVHRFFFPRLLSTLRSSLSSFASSGLLCFAAFSAFRASFSGESFFIDFSFRIFSAKFFDVPCGAYQLAPTIRMQRGAMNTVVPTCVSPFLFVIVVSPPTHSSLYLRSCLVGTVTGHLYGRRWSRQSRIGFVVW